MNIEDIDNEGSLEAVLDNRYGGGGPAGRMTVRNDISTAAVFEEGEDMLKLVDKLEEDGVKGTGTDNGGAMNIQAPNQDKVVVEQAPSRM